MNLAISYTLLALIATAANIGTQDLAIRLYSSEFSIMLSMMAGTGIGLIFKYVLDKRYIFRFRARDAVHDGQTFVLYCVMGLATTAIFWGFELGFNHWFATREMRYIGGIIGLALGYLAKYHLDKRYVFRLDAA